MKVAFFGLGRMGCVQARLARSFGDIIAFGCDICSDARDFFASEFGVPVHENPEQADFSDIDLLWLTVKDDEIENLASSLKNLNLPDCVVLHTSGVMSSEIISKHLINQSCGSLHPLMACPLRTISDEKCVEAYRGVIHAYEGAPRACEMSRLLIQRIPGEGVCIKTENKMLYHAGAVFASNYLLACMNTGCELLEACGLSREQAVSGALAMCRQNLHAAEASSLADALTGPVKRRDFSTIQKHEAALAAFPEVLELYRALKKATEKLAGYDNA